MFSIISEKKQLDEYLEEQAEAFQKRREVIPKLKTMPSGQALIEVVQALSDRYFALTMNTVPSEGPMIGYYQGAYHALNRILNEIEGEKEDESGRIQGS